jgi:hypothetical protein
MSCTFVEAGSARSMTLVKSLSSSLARFLETSGSEQMQTALIGSLASADHSRSDWLNSEMEGTRNRIKPFPLVSCSAMRRALNVLPVPHAMMSLPRSAVLKYA